MLTQIPMLTQKEAEAILLNFLERARAAKFKHNVSISPYISSKIVSLFRRSLHALVTILSQGQVPNGELHDAAHTLAGLLPEKIPASELEFLKKEITPPESPSKNRTLEKVVKIFEAAGRNKAGESTIPMPQPPSGVMTFEESQGIKQTGPASVDTLWLGRTGKETLGILCPHTRPRVVECPIPREAVGALDWMDYEEDLLLLPPAEKLRRYMAASGYEAFPVRTGNRPDQKIQKQKKVQKTQVKEQIAATYDGTAKTAYRLAALLDCAFKKNETNVDLVLKESYNKLRQEDRAGIYRALAKIAGHIKQLLPEATAKVESIRVFFGDHMVWVINLGSVAAGPERPRDPDEEEATNKEHN